MAITTDQSQNPTITHNINIGDSSGFKACIRWSCGTTAKLYSVASKFYKAGTGIQDDLIYTIQTDSSGVPSGTVLETITVPKATVNAWSPNDVFHEIMSAKTLSVTSGTTYWLVVDCAARDASNFVYFRYNVGTATGWDGVRDYSSGAWQTGGYGDTQAPNIIKVFTSDIKSLNGLAIASVKSANGLAKASAWSKNGLIF